MTTTYAQGIAAHYTRRHEHRGDLFGSQPFANYGYWPRSGMTMEQAAEELSDLVARSAGIGPGDRVLDVGCGYGAPAVAYTRRYRPAAVTGIDITEIRIQTGREHVARHGLSDIITLQLGDATRLDFKDASFNKLIAVECAFHFDTRRDFMLEAARVLEPGGTLALTDMIPRRGIDPKIYLKGHPTFYSGFCIDNPGNAYDADVYANYLREAGFTDIRIESIVEQTRSPFADAMEQVGLRTGGERGEIFRKGAERLREYIALGEDYVLVVAKRA